MKTFFAIVGSLAAFGLLVFLVSIAWALYEQYRRVKGAEKALRRFQELPMDQKLEEYAKKQGWLK